MTELEEILLVKKLLNKHGLPISPILEYAIISKEEQYREELPQKIESIVEVDFYKDINYYCQLFSMLSVRKIKEKKLPHKAILLLSIMNLISDGTIVDNHIYLDSHLTTEFALQWRKYIPEKHVQIPSMWTPFYHLISESFWHFHPKTSQDKLNEFLNFGGTPSIGKLKNYVEYAYFDKELFKLILDNRNRHTLEDILIKTYIKE